MLMGGRARAVITAFVGQEDANFSAYKCSLREVSLRDAGYSLNEAIADDTSRRGHVCEKLFAKNEVDSEHIWAPSWYMSWGPLWAPDKQDGLLQPQGLRGWAPWGYDRGGGAKTGR